ncbi:MAG TPA: hypothetical protein VN153_12730 [Tahibacter sp.]|nr:hypothetical protein [Tahibacter sp.]
MAADLVPVSPYSAILARRITIPLVTAIPVFIHRLRRKELERVTS